MILAGFGRFLCTVSERALLLWRAGWGQPLFHPKGGGGMGSSSVPTKRTPSAPQLLARCDSGELEAGNNPMGRHIAWWLITPTNHPSLGAHGGFRTSELLRRSRTWSSWKRSYPHQSIMVSRKDARKELQNLKVDPILCRTDIYYWSRGP